MKRKTILILAWVIFVILFCCCLSLAGLILWNAKTSSSDQTLFNGEFIKPVATPTPYIIIKITGEAESENEPGQASGSGNYAKDTGQKLVVCSNKIGTFSEIAICLNENINLVLDADYIDEINSSIDEIEASCTDIGQDEGVPPEYADINEELQMADEDMKNFVNNIHSGLDSFDIEAISQALYDLASASSHYENAGEYLK